MDKLRETIADVRPLDTKAMAAAQSRWSSIAKPLGSLGILEEDLTRIAGMTGNPSIDLKRRAVVAMCADNGVVAQGVTQTDSSVTAVVAENMSRGVSSVCIMAKLADADVIPVDIGIMRDVSGENLLIRKIAYGTGDITMGPAMTREQAVKAVETGIEIVETLKKDGYRILATGEMGIGNTTTASAVASVLLQRDPEELVGRGAGLSSEGLIRKRQAVKKAIVVNSPDPSDALDVLHKVGGFDIAGLTGVFLGGAAMRIPILIDGVISAAAALAAARICPMAGNYFLASHVSREPAAGLLLKELGLKPLLTAEMRLGEGTGAVAVLPLLDMACAVYREMSTFREIEIEEYRPQN